MVINGKGVTEMKRNLAEQLEMKLRTKQEREIDEEFDNDTDDLDDTVHDYVEDHAPKSIPALLSMVADAIGFWAELAMENDEISKSKEKEIEQIVYGVSTLKKKADRAIKSI